MLRPGSRIGQSLLLSARVQDFGSWGGLNLDDVLGQGAARYHGVLAVARLAGPQVSGTMVTHARGVRERVLADHPRGIGLSDLQLADLELFLALADLHAGEGREAAVAVLHILHDWSLTGALEADAVWALLAGGA